MEETLGENELRQISEIFMSFGSHLGLGFDATAPNSQTRLEKANITWLPRLPSPSSFQCEKNPLGEDDKGWPRDRLPIELFERVIRGLSRADILNLRLVSREFEKKVSRSVFRSVVVPFRPKIYRNVATDDAPGELPPDNALTESMTSQKGKSRDNEGSYGVPYHINHVDYNGMKIFDAWGKHIQKFAMTFDIDQEMFENPPAKGNYDKIQTFWGAYLWPPGHYPRYESCESQEERADETRLMTVALSNLGQVTELGLSVDNGLGWIVGPDLSDRSKIFGDKAAIFGRQFPLSDFEKLERNQAWDVLIAHIAIDGHSAGEASTTSNDEPRPLPSFMQTLYPDASFPCIPRYSHEFPPLIYEGVDLDPDRKGLWENLLEDEFIEPGFLRSRFKNALIIPNQLRSAQKEWLLENQWAQQAFLTSWSLAMIDNAMTFRTLRTLTIAHLSSKFLQNLQRHDLWMALKTLENLVLMLSPDWRDFSEGHGELAVMTNLRPSGASAKFRDFLKSCIVGACNIKKLKIGFIGGGERARGMFARNKNVLPAPVLDFSSEAGLIQVLLLPHVRHLTLSNCWMSPDALKEFTLLMSTHMLESLVLDSVSLTAPLEKEPSLPFDNDISLAMYGFERPNSIDHLDVDIPSDKAEFRKLLFRHGIDTTILDGLSPPDAPIPTWLTEDPSSRSWPDVINTITPGETLECKRHLEGYLEEKPKLQENGRLRQIQFISCGYVCLRHADFDQPSIGGTVDFGVPALWERYLDLTAVMMRAYHDPLLGTISPTIEYEEARCLVFGLGMTLGWPDDDKTKFEFREDGQPIGGSGRFSGTVEQLPVASDPMGSLS